MSEDAHNRVLEAALELFVEKGIDPTTMDALAAASGVSKATIYKHWPEGKEQLLMELLLTVSGAAEKVVEQDSGNLFEDLARVLNDKPRNARPEAMGRLMPQMIAYSVIHVDFGNAWRSRVMEEPRRRIRRILTDAIADGRLPQTLDVDVCFALLLGPMMYSHIFGQGRSWLGRAKSMKEEGQQNKEHPSQCAGSLTKETVELGSKVAEAFCRAHEQR